jgi:hypothetical protein
VHANPLYGYGYDPSWPSVLSVAHDEADGGRVFVITDRPCVLVGSPTGLPLAVAAAGGLSVLGAVQVSPIKFRVTLNGAAPQGAAWNWGASAGGAGSGNLVDPITNHPVNPASGDCADVPGPYVPPTPAAVLHAQPDGSQCVLEFDRAVVLKYPPVAVDESILFDGAPPTDVNNLSATVLRFSLASSVSPGSTWAIQWQPPYCASILASPTDGVFE